MTDLPVPDHRSFKDAVHAEDGGLRRVDNRGPEEWPENAAIAEKWRRF